MVLGEIKLALTCIVYLLIGDQGRHLEAVYPTIA